jgi:hypothetical protein
MCAHLGAEKTANMVNFRYTVSALTYSLVHDRCADEAENGVFLENDVARFVLAQYLRTPDCMRFALGALTIVFDLWPLLIHGRPFHRLAPEIRLRQIDRWRSSRFGVMRDLIRYYEGLVVFGWYAFRDERLSATR